MPKIKFIRLDKEVFTWEVAGVEINNGIEIFHRKVPFKAIILIIVLQ